MLKNLTPSLQELIPSLIGDRHPKDAIYGTFDPALARPRVLRPLHAQSSTLSTYVIPATFPEDPRRWYPEEPSTYPLREGNELEYYIDGQDTYEAMVEAIQTATGPDHFIVLIGWAAHFDFQLTKKGARGPGAERTAAEVLEERVKLGVKIRVLLWNNSQLNDADSSGNYYCKLTKKIVDTWVHHGPTDESPRRAIAIVDGATREAGSHHQKILLVYGTDGLIGFFGGVDFNSDRVNKEKLGLPYLPGALNVPGLGLGRPMIEVEGPLHDVHARVRGPAASDLLVLASKRWNLSRPVDIRQSLDRFDRKEPTYWDPNLAGRSSPAEFGHEIENLDHFLGKAAKGSTTPPTPHRLVRIAQTVGNPRLLPIESTKGVQNMILGAIQTAKQFIYVEDQYLWSRSAMSAILERIGVLRHVTMLTPPDRALELQVPFDVQIQPGIGLPKGTRLSRGLSSPRHAALRFLLDEAARKGLLDVVREKVRIYERVGNDHTYIHAKASIYDDEFAIVGSANWNDRGFTYDSEVVAGISDASWQAAGSSRDGAWYSLELDFARKLRMVLWCEHLGVTPDQVWDGIASEHHWRERMAVACVCPYLVDGVLWHEAPAVLACDYVQSGMPDELIDPDDNLSRSVGPARP